MTRPTIHDVADAAQVSLATVDRVLNNRGGVAAKSVKKVKQAIAQTGYVRDRAAANMSRSKFYRITFIIPDTTNAFLDQLCDAITLQDAMLRQDRVSLTIRYVAAFSAPAYCAALQSLSADTCDAVVLMGIEDADVHAEIQSLTDTGVRVVTMVSDLPAARRADYVGPDNVAAGRTAAAFLGRFVRQGNVLLLPGAKAVRDHVDRRQGFQDIMAQDFPAISVHVADEGADDAVQTFDRLRDNFAEKALVGVYNVGAGNSGLLLALREIPEHMRPVTILHELTPMNRDALQSGLIDLVIDQNPAEEVARAISMIRNLIDGRSVASDAGLIQPQIFVKQNLP
ncbi:LacI family transcriptional regulator [Cognatiyoonia koreensis]|uniref:LacI family transcriptional regulator n=1 Tax=Cognatiyoonia koreensis TaxID=364200 RepID=A0A1I0RQG9_9RHOB|nr:LacI family DNA-binding transcriptional regulator [Cognatiyoonia koreensis]SEW43608.1 LacI family transcriptional regulator [Cognatiyoonia koreensis]